METVRSLIYDGLSESDVANLHKLMSHILERIESSGLRSSC